MRKTLSNWHPIIQDYVMRDWKDLIKEGIAMQSYDDGKWDYWLVDNSEPSYNQSMESTISERVKEIINNAFYYNWYEEMEAGSKMDLDTFKMRAFFHMQELDGMKGVDVKWDLVEKFIEEEHATGYCTSWGEAFSTTNMYEEVSNLTK